MKNRFARISLCILLTLACFLGTAAGTAPEEAPKQTLPITVTLSHAFDAGFTVIPLTQGNYDSVSYLGISDVTIDIDGTTRKLADALQDGSVTVDQLIADARQDAVLGFCHEGVTSKNGLAEFTYYYGDYRLHYVYDVYETPDGRKHLIKDFTIYNSYSAPVNFGYSYDEDGNPIDYEDWGLTFQVSNADSAALTVVCTQSGGQQFGTLQLNEIYLQKKNPDTLEWESLEDGYAHACEGTALTMGGTTELTLDLAETYGALSAGDYCIVMQFLDCYNPEDMPSLMRKYHDKQWYTVEFTLQPRS